MTTVTSTTSTTADTSGTGALSKLSGDFDMFLKLLTTQMQNQDPLDPMDTSEYTQQLVQYSQVEQSISQSGTLKQILASLSTQNLTQASGLIGQTVVIDSPVAGLTADTPALWDYSAGANITQLRATITDSSGKIVQEQTVDASNKAGVFSWNGTTKAGGTAPEGSYTLALTGISASGSDVAVAVNSLGTVRDVRSGEEGLVLGVNGALFPAGSIVRVGS